MNFNLIIAISLAQENSVKLVVFNRISERCSDQQKGCTANSVR